MYEEQEKIEQVRKKSYLNKFESKSFGFSAIVYKIFGFDLDILDPLTNMMISVAIILISIILLLWLYKMVKGMVRNQRKNKFIKKLENDEGIINEIRQKKE